MKKITLILFVAFASILNATTYYVDGTRPDDSGDGLSWSTAKKTISAVITLANTGGPATVADNIYIKEGTYNLSTQMLTGDYDSYYGGFSGTESTPADRVKSDKDGNSVIDPWEFTNVTLLNSTYDSSSSTAANAFEFGTSTTGIGTININGISFTHTVASATSAQRTFKMNHPLVVFENNIVKNCNYTSVNNTTNGNGGTLATCFGTFKNCLIEKNTIIATSAADKPIIGGLSFGKGGKLVGCVIRNNKITIDCSTFTGTITGGNIANITGQILNSNGGAASPLQISFTNSLIYNNEATYIPPTAFPTTTVSSSGLVSMTFIANGNDEMFNCVIANNKVGTLTGGLLIKRGTTQTRNVRNNILWNNKNSADPAAVKNLNIVLSGGTFNLTNNIRNADGNDFLSYSSTNVSDLSATNTGANPPSFKTPTSSVGYLADGTVEISNWSLLSGSYLIAKGTATSNLTDYSGITFLTPRSVGAYEITVPDAPTSVIATSGSTHASVAFAVPADGGSAILDYTVTPYIGAIAGTPVTGSSSPIVVTGLTNGTAYTFTVTARNANGISVVSASSNEITPSPATGLTQQGSEIKLAITNNLLNISGLKTGENVAVFLPSGILYKKVVAVNNGTEFNLSSGVYIVKTSTSVHKILMY